MAPTASRDRRSLAISARHERLDRGLDPWRSLRLDALMLPAGRTGGYGALVAEERFGLRDAGLEAGIVVPLGRGWTVQPEVGLVADADFLPRHYLDLRLQRVLEGGWIGTASLRHSAYRDVDVQRLALGVERYAGAWRAAYTLNLTRLAGDESVGHDLRLARAYGERSEVGLQVGFGREAALIGPQVVASDVRATVLFGRHAVGAWALLWNVGRVRQGVLYTREGLGLGLERRF
jgi:YaiO family outer membrane protein